MELFSATFAAFRGIHPLNELSQLHTGFGVQLVLRQMAHNHLLPFVSLQFFRSLLHGLCKFLHSVPSFHWRFPLCSLQNNIGVFVSGSLQKQDIEKLCQIITQIVQKLKIHCRHPRIAGILNWQNSLFPRSSNIFLSQAIHPYLILLFLLSKPRSPTVQKITC